MIVYLTAHLFTHGIEPVEATVNKYNFTCIDVGTRSVFKPDWHATYADAVVEARRKIARRAKILAKEMIKLDELEQHLLGLL